MKKIFLPLILFLSVILVSSVLAVTNGTIDSVYKYAWSDKVGWINFAPNNGSQNGSYAGLHISNTAVTGYAWGQSAGWINFSPTQGGVLNNPSGTLSGSAFGEDLGWINFSGVKISCLGQFTGKATGDNVGTINFDCQNCKVVTNWLPTQGCGTHNACSNNQCVSVAGSGVDQCSSDSDCNVEKHNACNAQSQCISVSGSGFDQCQTNTDCSTHHNECNQEQCVAVQGLGVDQCQSNSNCIVEKHNACNNQFQCVVLNGAGQDTCQTNSDCGNVVISQKHNECNLFSQCTLVNGPGTNQCQVNSDCGLPIIVENVIKDITKPVAVAVEPLVENIKKATEVVKEIIKSPEGSLVTKVITTTGVVVAATATVTAVVTATATSATTLVATGTTVFIPSLFDIGLSLIRLWGLLLTGLGIKKRAKNWGTVYDSVTKQPLDPAQVLLKDSDGNVVATAITDIDGRYGFLVPPGTYKIVTKKTNYAFPSEKLAGKSQDEVYNNLYFGEPIAIRNFGEVIAKNIPMDPVKFDWNEFAKKNKTFMKFYSKWDVAIKRFVDFSYGIGFVVAVIAFISVPEPYNSIILGLYLILLLLRIFGLKPKSFGYIIDTTTSEPLSFAIVRVVIPNTSVEVAHKIADAYGRYYCLVPKGQYQVKIERKNKDGSYLAIYTSSIINVSKKGIIKEKFKIDASIPNSHMGPKNTPDIKNNPLPPNMPEQKNLRERSEHLSRQQAGQNPNNDQKLDIDPSLLIHQLKSPLSSMKLSTEMFLDGNFGNLTKEQKEIIQKMHSKSENLMSLVNDLSDINKIKQRFSSFNFSSENVLDLIWNMVALKKEDVDAKKINLKVNEVKMPQIKVDKEKISIALENVFDNAIKYNKSGGVIDISFEDKGGSILIKFLDSGIGIPSADQGNIFSKFFRAQNAKKIDQFGSGLGLFIAKNIIENHHGKIWFESEENKGSTFFIELPKN